MEIISATEFQNNFGTYLKRVKDGEDFQVTSYGEVIGTFASKKSKEIPIKNPLIGCLDGDYDREVIREEVLKKYDSLS